MGEAKSVATGGGAPKFRHTIGDALYDLFEDFDNQLPDRVMVWPVVKVTERYVYVHGPQLWRRDRTYRFSRDDLEVKGRAWNQKHRLALYVRPLLDWPPIVQDIGRVEPAAIEAGAS